MTVSLMARRVLKTMFRLGMFDPLEGNIYANIPPEMVDRPAARAESLEAATKGSVLLKNDGVLPLLAALGTPGREAAAGSAAKLAFIGPHINSTQDMLSAPQYHGQNTLVNSHSPLLVALRRGWAVTYEKGCNICDVQPKGYPVRVWPQPLHVPGPMCLDASCSCGSSN